MKLLLHDYGGYAFIAQLGRALAGRGHQLVHAYSGSVQTPQGLLRKARPTQRGLSSAPSG